MSRLIASNWFLLALVVCYAGGHFAADRLRPVVEQAWLRSCVLVAVMWAMGVTLNASQIVKSVQKPTASLLAIGCNLFLVPVCCAISMGWLSASIGGSLGRELAGGLFVAGLVPCTLASASVWTRKAGGDDSVSMICTVVTNVGCLLVVPVGIHLVLAMQTKLSPVAQMEKLAWFVVLPLVIAQLMRRFGAGPWADRNKSALSKLAQIGILAMVVFGAVAGQSIAANGSVESTGAESGQGRGVGWWPILAVIIAASGVHLFVFAAGWMLARALKRPREEQIAVGIAGSQKTLMVGLQIAIDCGVSVLPMMIYHAGQLIIDTFIVNRWKRLVPEPRENIQELKDNQSVSA
ncbi:MAG: bile acid:sodium symporter [Planctomycetota bacterium]